MEKIERGSLKVRRALAKHYGTIENMNKALTQIDTDKNGNMSVDEFKTFLLDSCGKSLLDQKLDKKDLEGFMSSFVFNA